MCKKKIGLIIHSSILEFLFWIRSLKLNDKKLPTLYGQKLMGWVIDWWTHCVCDSAWLKRTISKTINLKHYCICNSPRKIYCYRIKKKSELINKWLLEAEPETHWFSKWVERMAKYRHLSFLQTWIDWLILLFLEGRGVLNIGHEMKFFDNGMTHAAESFTRSLSRFRRNGLLKVIDWFTPSD